ncbi:MAG: M1 family metallopeptidase [Bacteroidales bacterium]
MNIFKFFFIFVCLLNVCSSSVIIAQSYRDSTNVLQYDIRLNITDFSSKTIQGHTTLTLLRARTEGPLKLDLQGLVVDSLISDGFPLSYKQNGQVLSFLPLKCAGDTLTVTVYYQGKPAQDARWGGFYFTSLEAFNYGVGMAAEPPNFGRAWFPCIDNFSDRAVYSFDIRVPQGYMAVCNGILMGTQRYPDNTISWKWTIREEIPTYLASVAVAPYDSILYSYQSGNRKIPVTIYDLKQNLENARHSLANLPRWMEVFERRFGPYRWDRIGYVMVPFRGGAMEHATNIALSRITVNGDLSRETLYAHELSHSWFGNLVTCAGEADMWLNEGFASYAESIMMEGVYGREAFLKNIRQNQKDVLEKTPMEDGGYFPLYNLPHRLTYGSTVYDKGAMVVHNLRGLLGDSVFFNTVKKYLDHYAFSTCSVKELQNFFSEATGIDLNSFFDFWVYGPGFNEVSILRFSTSKEKNVFTTEFFLIQNLLGTGAYEKMPETDLLLVGNQLEKKLVHVKLKDTDCIVRVESPFKPVMIIVDPEERRLDAVIQETIDLPVGEGTNTTACSFSFSYKNQKRPGLLEVEQHRIPMVRTTIPEKFKPLDGTYWKISHAGSMPVNYSGTFEFDPSVVNKNYLLLYKKTELNPWVAIPAKKTPGQDNRSGFTTSQLKGGFYSIGIQQE